MTRRLDNSDPHEKPKTVTGAEVPSVAVAPPRGKGADGPPPPRSLTIVNRRGLHARASARFVQTAEAFDAELTISRDGLTVGGQSIMGLMMLAASQGTVIEVAARGADAEAALDAIEALVADRFGESA
ncbi:HPr family phosphocarrier protein [Aurantimonas sp. C2-3-R2]|uniref:HPr family phosphocarrier protein n=1 Tax=unclassified Aurantimonas TaxID=2638230 RepID=UPI003FA4BB2C